MGGGVFVPPIWRASWQVWFCSMQPQERKDDEHTNGPPRLSSLFSFPHACYTAMVQASDLPYVYSLQCSSSQLPHDEEAAEKAFWQSTPTALEELRDGTEDESHQAGAPLSRLS